MNDAGVVGSKSREEGHSYRRKKWRESRQRQSIPDKRRQMAIPRDIFQTKTDLLIIGTTAPTNHKNILIRKMIYNCLLPNTTNYHFYFILFL